MSAESSDRRAGNGGGDGSPDPTMARAEEMVDRLGERVGHLLTVAGKRAQKAVARAREEAEDIWAEAQHMRRNGQS